MKTMNTILESGAMKKPLIDCKESIKKIAKYCNEKNLVCFISSNNIRVYKDIYSNIFIDIDYINFDDTVEKIEKFFNI